MPKITDLKELACNGDLNELPSICVVISIDVISIQGNIAFSAAYYHRRNLDLTDSDAGKVQEKS